MLPESEQMTMRKSMDVRISKKPSLLMIAALVSLCVVLPVHVESTRDTGAYRLSLGVDTALAKPKFIKKIFKGKPKPKKTIVPKKQTGTTPKKTGESRTPAIKFNSAPNAQRDFTKAAPGVGKATKQKLTGKRIVSGLAVKADRTFRGMSYRKAIRTADKTYKKKGWKKEKLRDGNGYKYTDPKNPGTKIFVNKGYKKTKNQDDIHGGPYIKVSAEGTTQRIPLKGNPTLKN